MEEEKIVIEAETEEEAIEKAKEIITEEEGVSVEEVVA